MRSSEESKVGCLLTGTKMAGENRRRAAWDFMVGLELRVLLCKSQDLHGLNFLQVPKEKASRRSYQFARMGQKGKESSGD